ncbi:MAG: glycosyltransferase [Nanoarchaeota archaeon]
MKQNKEPNVTIIIPTHSAPIDTVVAALRKQKYTGKVTIIALDNGERDRTKEMPKGVTYIKNKQNLGLAGSLNKGILLASTPYVITLHQDCVPVGSDWLSALMLPFADSSVVLSASQQILPKEIWNKFSFWHKVFAVPELQMQKTIHERATVYKTSVVEECGLFDNTTYLTAGEDADLFMKMKAYGKFVVSSALVSHIHAPHNDSLWKFIKTFLRCHEAMGVLHRKYLFRMGFQFVYDLVKTVLMLFLVVFLFFNVGVSLFIFGVIVVLANIMHLGVVRYVCDWRLVFVPFVYTFVWFATLIVMWKGFVSGKQRIH